MDKKELIEILNSMGHEGVADAVAEQVADNFTKASNDVIGVLCDALRDTGELIPSDAIKLMNVMKKRDLKEIKKILASASDKSIEEIDNMLEVLAQDNDDFAQALFDYQGKESTSYKDDDMLKSILQTSADSMKEDIINISKTSAITVNGNSIAIDKAYVKVVNQGIFATQQGYTDFNTAVRQVVKKMAADGVRSVTFSNGSKRRLDSQARMNILEGVKRFNYNYRMAKGEQYGADGVEIDVHFPCAPDHLPYQGKLYSNKDFEKLQGSLKRPIGDMNCRHSVTPIVLGISEPAYSDEEIKEAKELSEKEVTYTDSRGVKRTCTGYEATQVQRRMETKVRRLKDQQSSLKRLGDDMGAREVGKQVTRAKKEYYRVSDELGLRARDNRLGYSTKVLNKNNVTISKVKKPSVKRNKDIVFKKNIKSSDIDKMSRNDLIKNAREVYLRENSDDKDALYKFNSLVSSNSNTHLKKYLKKRKDMLNDNTFDTKKSKMASNKSTNNKWNSAKSRIVSKEEKKSIIDYAKSKDVNIVDISKFDGDRKVLESCIDEISKKKLEYNIKSKITITVSDKLVDEDYAITTNKTINFNAKILRDRKLTEKNILNDEQFASKKVEDIAIHEMGHIIGNIKGNKGVELTQKAYYNIYKEHLDENEIINFLEKNISIYAIKYHGDLDDPRGIDVKKFKEVISEVMAKNNSNADDFTREFVKLLKEG